MRRRNYTSILACVACLAIATGCNGRLRNFDAIDAGTGGSDDGAAGGGGSAGTGGTAGSGGTGGSITLASPRRNYAVPTSNRIFVSQANGDDGAGDAAHDSGTPFKTVRAALDYLDSKNRSGWTIVVSAGVYRETLSPQVSGGKPQQRREVFTLQPNGTDEVWLSGSDRVDGSLTRDGGSGYWYAAWDSPLCDCGKNPCADKGGSQCVESGVFDQSPPFAGRPEMAFVDGVGLRQVGSLGALADDAFYVDANAGRLYFGRTNIDNGYVVEISRRRTALRTQADGVRLIGIGFRHYGSEQHLGNAAAAAVVGEAGSNLWVEDCRFVDNAARGLALVRTENATVLDSVFRTNGHSGMSATLAHDFALLRSFLVGNNAELFIAGGANGAVAGMKVTRTQGMRVQSTIFEGNHATGLWCDISCLDTVILGNLIRGNVRHGVYYEMSARGVIASNVLLDNTTGARISGSNDVVFWNNAMSSNNNAFSVYEDLRTCPGNCPSQWENDHSDEATWDVADVSVANNLVSSGQKSGAVLLDHGISGGISATETFARLDYQSYHRTTAGAVPVFVKWEGSNYNDLAAWQSANGVSSLPASIREANAAVSTGASSSPFADASRGDYGPSSGLPSTALSGAPISITAAVNGAPGSAPFDSAPANATGPWSWPQAAAAQQTVLSIGDPTDLRVASTASPSLLPVCQYDNGGAKAYAPSPMGDTADCDNGTAPPAGSLAAELWSAGFTTKQGVAFYTSDRPDTGLVPVYAVRLANGSVTMSSSPSRLGALVDKGATIVGLAFYASLHTGAR